MTLKNFMFTIGYQGDSALVDRANLEKYGNMEESELLAAGLYKPAFSRALYKEDQEGMERVLSSYNSKTPQKYKNLEEIKKAFGVFSVPQNITKTIFL